MQALPQASDRDVIILSEALRGVCVDVVVSGSIGAVEAVRFIRALRRLGAEVTPWLTQGGAQFTTETALSWAAARPTRTHFAGDAAHVSEGHACVLAPASASMLARLACGLTDTPASALVSSYLGRLAQGQPVPVIALANMHDSLWHAPAVQANIDRLRSFGLAFVASRGEEHKQKFPEPRALADEVAHRINRARHGRTASVLLTMGTTRAYLDDVRYLSNYSSGALGSAIAEELYRLGYSTDVVAGPAKVNPSVSTRLTQVETNAAMLEEAERAMQRGIDAAVMAASVLDYVPTERQSGKLRSGQGQLSMTLTGTEKIIAKIQPNRPIKVGFKLESGLEPAAAARLAEDYGQRYGLSLIVINDLRHVDRERHQALVWERDRAGALRGPVAVHGKAEVAAFVAAHIHQQLSQN